MRGGVYSYGTEVHVPWVKQLDKLKKLKDKVRQL